MVIITNILQYVYVGKLSPYSYTSVPIEMAGDAS